MSLKSLEKTISDCSDIVKGNVNPNSEKESEFKKLFLVGIVSILTGVLWLIVGDGFFRTGGFIFAGFGVLMFASSFSSLSGRVSPKTSRQNLINAYRKYNSEYSDILNGNWKIPYEKIKEKCDSEVVKTVNNAFDYKKFRSIIENIMIEEGIPEMCRVIYANEDALRDIFEKSTGSSSKIKEMSNTEAEKIINDEIRKTTLLKPVSIGYSSLKKAAIVNISKPSANSAQKNKPKKEVAVDKWYVLSLFKPNYAYTISDLREIDSELSKLQTSKISSYVRQLKEDGYLNREEIKRVAYFSLSDKGISANKAHKNISSNNSAKKKTVQKNNTKKEVTVDKWYVLSLFKPDYAYTISDLQKIDNKLSKLSTSAISAYVRQLKEDGLVKREDIGRVAYFSLVDDNDDDDYDSYYNSDDGDTGFDIPIDFHVTINGKEYRF